MKKIQYNEDIELDRYVLDYFPQLMTEKEYLAQQSIYAEVKADSTNCLVLKKKIIKKWGASEDLVVKALLADGIDAFRRKVRQRIVQDHGSKIFINRCPQCNKVVMTPKARVCLWCHFSWV